MEYDHAKLNKIVDVARMYYEKNMTQSDIGKTLDISRSLVSKLLTEARTLGIVKVTINSPIQDDKQMEARLIEMFGLKQVNIVQATDAFEVNNRFIVDAAADFLVKHLDTLKAIGVSWGKLMSDMVSRIRLKDEQKYSGFVCPLVGNANSHYQEYHTDSIVMKLSSRIGYSQKFIYSPAYFDSADEYETFMNLYNQVKLMKRWKKLDVAFLNIENHPSTPDMATALRFGKKLLEQRAVGHMASHYYNEKGDVIQSETNYSNNIPISDLENIKTVVGICSAANSIEAIIGALNTGLITHLFLTSTQAKDLIRFVENR